jgi:poly(3-hydroxybutyrate) depolymerase
MRLRPFALVLRVTLSALPIAGAKGAEMPPEACSTAVQLGANGFEAEPARGSFDMSFEVTGLGLRSVRLHVPDAILPPRRAPLLIALHGAAGAGNAPLAAGFIRDAWTATADAGGFVLLAPIASGAQGGWAPSLDYPILAQAIAEVGARYPIDTRRIYLHGYSAGGHVAHDLGLYNPDYFAAYAVNAGVLQALAGPTAPNFAATMRRIRAQVRIGDGDTLLSPTAEDRLRFLAAGWSEPGDYQRVVFVGGHAFDASHTAPAWEFLCRRALLP